MSTDHPGPAQATAAEIWRPAPGTGLQWQLSGAIDLTVAADVYDVDLFEADRSIIDALHGRNRRVICYVSVGTVEDWRPDAQRYADAAVGRDYPGWPGERWLDIRQIDLLAPVLRDRLDLARSKGCDAIEPDNIDAYEADSGFPLDAADQIAFVRWLAAESHARGLSIGLKNAPELLDDVIDEVDWVLTEDCHARGWCDRVAIAAARGLAVFQVEYTDAAVDWTEACRAATARGFFALLKNRDLDAFRRTCP